MSLKQINHMMTYLDLKTISQFTGQIPPEHYSSWKFSPRIICLQNSWKFLQQSFVTMKVFQLAFTCSKSTIETLDQGVKYVQS